MLISKQGLNTSRYQWLRMNFYYLGVFFWLSAILMLFGFALTQLALGLFISCGVSLVCGCLMRSSQQNVW